MRCLTERACVRRTLCVVILTSLTLSCVAEPLPEPAPLRPAADSRGYPMAPRPPCGVSIMAAIVDPVLPDLEALLAAVQRGEEVTCGSNEGPLPLDVAVLHDRPDVVRALLEAGADPSVRWTLKGDRFPLQEAIEPTFRSPVLHRREIVGLLLRHRADPNARWCPSESRLGVPRVMQGCESDGGVTPLIAAAFYDLADTTYLLLGAGADPAVLDGRGFSALDYASGRAVFELLLAAQFRDPATRRAQALTFRKSLQANVWLSPSLPPPPPRISTSPAAKAPAGR